MTNKAQQNTVAIPQLVYYVQLELPAIMPASQVSFETLLESITLQAQGEAVEISEESQIPFLMKVFDVAHRVSSEMVLRLKSGKRVLLFDHQSAPVLRDTSIIDRFINTSKHELKSNSKEFVQELVIGIEEIWAETKNDDYFKTIENTLKKINSMTMPSMITTLVGKAPALLFLLAQHKLQGKTGEIWYQENLVSAPVRITRL